MPQSPGRRLLALPLNIIRGVLIGMAELVPGVSGGTIALVTGVYDDLIGSAHHVVHGVKRLVLGPDRVASFRADMRKANWLLLLPLLVGMGIAVVSMAGTMEAFVTGHPELARGLFLGLVAASLVVPIRMLPTRDGGWSVTEVVAFLAAAAATFVMTGFVGAGQAEDPNLLLVFLAASVAICALVLPGVSGSFFLLVVGFYSATMAAVSDFDVVYILVFAAGAIIGLGSFVQLLRHLLEHRRRITLIVMAGLMLGSLRALWPWQAPAGEDETFSQLLAPQAPVWGPIGLAALGAAVVLVLIIVEARFAPPEDQEITRSDTEV